jgi:hypothetical protein
MRRYESNVERYVLDRSTRRRQNIAKLPDLIRNAKAARFPLL